MGDVMDQNEAYERKRKEMIQKLRDDLEKDKSYSYEQKRILYEFIGALEEANIGIDAAHNRIRIRKKELAKLNRNIKLMGLAQLRLIEGIEEYQSSIAKTLTSEIQKINNRNRKYMTLISVIGLVIVAFMAFILFGSKEMVNILSGLTTALKFAQVIL